MTRHVPTVRAVVVPAATATAASAVALALVARFERKGPLRPLNATSHWLHGDAAAAVEGFDGAHTGVGFATHAAATLFWTVPFAWWVRMSRAGGAPGIVARATAIAASAALIDYRATPERFTPGWEKVLTRGGMTVTYAAMAAGLALGAVVAGTGTDRDGRTDRS